MSEYKPANISVPSNTHILIGIGDQRATDFEVHVMQRDQTFGRKFNEVVLGSSFGNINQTSFQDFRTYLKAFNCDLPYNSLSDGDFSIKTGILSNGLLTVGGLLMFGN